MIQLVSQIVKVWYFNNFYQRILCAQDPRKDRYLGLSASILSILSLSSPLTRVSVSVEQS